MRTKLISLAVALLITLPLVSACTKKQQTAATGPVTLTFYGLDPSDVWAPIITSYKKRQPTVTIRYLKFDNRDDYQNSLINQIAEGEGPDVMYIHNSWLPRHTKKLVPLNSQSLTPETFGTAFVNVAQEDLLQPDPKDGARKIYALPLFVDTLALYYNQDHYEKALPEKGKPGTTWDEIKRESASLRSVDEQTGELTRGSLALGRSDSVSLAADIVMNLILQAGVAFYDADFKQSKFAQDGQAAFDLFLGFANRRAKEFGWSSDLASVTGAAPEVESFVSGKVSSIVGYASLYSRLDDEIKAVKNKNINPIALADIKIAPLPQMSTDEATHKVLASYYGLGVSRNSKNQVLAWDFIQFAASKESSTAYVNKTKLPSARRDLLEAQKKDAVLAVFISQMGSSTSIKQVSESRYREIFEDAITKVAGGMASRSALGEAQAKINEILKREVPQGLYPKVIVPRKK